jgi:hypothetical protein
MIRTVAFALCLWAVAATAYADSLQVLPAGRLRLEAGPPDLGLLDSGYVGEGRGFRVGRIDREPEGDTVAQMGLGVSYGVSRRWEVGVLAVPVHLAPDARYGDLELHTRFAALRSRHVQLAFQGVLQFPTDTEFGLGLGMPLRFSGGRVFVDTGVELELLFGDYDLTNLDVPVAFNVYLRHNLYLGLRSGVFVFDFADAFVPLGFQVGGHAARRKVDLVGWFLWPPPPWRGSWEPIDVRSFQLGFGVSFLIDT